jgi:hypothetical protein
MAVGRELCKTAKRTAGKEITSPAWHWHRLGRNFPAIQSAQPSAVDAYIGEGVIWLRSKPATTGLSPDRSQDTQARRIGIFMI